MAPFLLDTKSSPPRGAQKKKSFGGGIYLRLTVKAELLGPFVQTRVELVNTWDSCEVSELFTWVRTIQPPPLLQPQDSLNWPLYIFRIL